MGSIVYEFNVLFKKERFGQQELIENILIKLGIDQKEIIETEEDDRRRLSFFVLTLNRAKTIKKKFENLRLKEIKPWIQKLKDKDWQTRWKEGFQPFNITKRIHIVPLWKKAAGKNYSEHTIFIDTNKVFGIGQHPTTRFIAEFMDKNRGKFDKFLDIGTGTGILLLVAKQCGAKILWGIDNDKEAIKTAKQNLRNNNAKVNFLKPCDFKNFKSKQRFDFVAANLTTEPLIEFKKKLISFVAKGKYLVVSGILLGKYALFHKKFDSSHLKCLHIKKSNGWCGILYKVG